jgi:hypothetical protein
MSIQTKSFELDPAFVAGLHQQPARSVKLQADVKSLRNLFAQQSATLASHSIGVPVLPTIQQTDAILADLQTKATAWDTQLRTGLTDLVANFSDFTQTVEDEEDADVIGEAWQTSIETAKTVGSTLAQLSKQVTDTYIKLPDQQRQLNALAQSVAVLVTNSQVLIRMAQQNMAEQQRQIDKVNNDKAIASIFVGSLIANSLGDLFTGMEGMKNNLNNLNQQVNAQQQVANGLNQFSSALNGVMTGLQTFTGQYAQISNQWSALSADMSNFTDALANRIHPGSVFMGPQVATATDDLNAVLKLFEAK